MAAKHLVVIGGSAAGPKAAAKARRLDPHAEITIVQQSPDLSMASCGYPYYVGGCFDDRNELLCTPTGVVRDAKFYANAKGIRALVCTRATSIDRKGHQVTCQDLGTGETLVLPYDKLVLATGATAVRPPVPGVELEGVTTLQSMQDADYLRRLRDEGRIRRAVVVGGGLIGVETCEALQLAGIGVTVVEMLPQILGFLDAELAALVRNHMLAKGAGVRTGEAVTAFVGTEGRLTGVALGNGEVLPCELAVVAAGVRPNSELAQAAGLPVGQRGGVLVNEYLQTADADIYAAGDCIEVPHLISGATVHAPLGDLANLQGRVAAQNAMEGNHARFPGTLQTGVCKVFAYAAGSTGLNERQAAAAGFATVSMLTAGPDKPGYMGANPLIIKMVAEQGTGRLLGVQCVGPGDASKRLAAAAMALHGRLTVTDLTVADLPYAPPFSPAIDNLIVAAHALENKMAGRLTGIAAAEVKRKVEAGEDLLLLDVRGQDEYELMRLGLGEVLIPLGALRRRLGELPADKGKEIICFCKISLRGYEAATLLQAHGWTNVKVLEGGLAAWPYPRG